jgi:hypothetical protein
LIVGGHEQSIKLDIDFISGFGNSRKLFKSDNLPLLYWWQTFNGMILHGGKQGYTFACPCRLENTPLVICMILKTRCNRAHIDSLMYDINEDRCFTIKQTDETWYNRYKCAPEEPFDLQKVKE